MAKILNSLQEWVHDRFVPVIRTRDAATIRTRDPGLPLFGPNDAIRTATPRERGQTRDQLNTVEPTGRTISRGSYWDGTGVNKKLDAAAAPVRDFVGGYTLGNIIHAVDPGKVIDLARTFTPLVGDEELRAGVERQVDALEAEWRADPRSSGIEGRKPSKTFTPGTDSRTGKRARDYGTTEFDEEGNPVSGPMFPQGGTRDARAPQRPTRSGLFDTGRTASYAQGLKDGRVTPAATKDTHMTQRPSSVLFDAGRTVRYAEGMAAARAKMAEKS